MANTITTNTTNNNTTLAARAAGLLTKASALDVVSKAIDQAIAAKRVHPAMAQDFGTQLGIELPLKTKDFVRVVGHLLASAEKPLKGVISKRKHEILVVLADLVAALTDTEAVALPAWAVPKERAKKAEETSAEAEASAVGALEKANILAEAEANAAKAEAAQDLKLAQAVALIVANAAELSADQRAVLLAVLATEASSEAEAEESAEASSEAEAD